MIGPIWRRHALLGAFVVAVLTAHPGTVDALIDLSRNDSTASHHVLIPFVVLVLVLQSRGSIFKSVRTAAPAGLGVIVAGLGLAWLSRVRAPSFGGHDALSLAVAVLVVMCLGAFLLLYGPHAFRAALFPLLFLGFTIPIPTGLLQTTTQFLKTGSAEMVAGLFTLVGTPYHREAFVFTLPTFAIEIADECSGIRSSIALLLTSLLAGHLFLGRKWSKAALVAAVLPVAILKNAVRIVGLSLLATHVDPAFLSGQLHHEGGIVFFLLALIILAPLFVLLSRSEIEPGGGTRGTKSMIALADSVPRGQS